MLRNLTVTVAFDAMHGCEVSREWLLASIAYI
jgi:hypothetical protein